VHAPNGDGLRASFDGEAESCFELIFPARRDSKTLRPKVRSQPTRFANVHRLFHLLTDEGFAIFIVQIPIRVSTEDVEPTDVGDSIPWE